MLCRVYGQVQWTLKVFQYPENAFFESLRKFNAVKYFENANGDIAHISILQWCRVKIKSLSSFWKSSTETLETPNALLTFVNDRFVHYSSKPISNEDHRTFRTSKSFIRALEKLSTVLQKCKWKRSIHFNSKLAPNRNVMFFRIPKKLCLAFRTD